MLDFSPHALLLRLTDLNSMDEETDMRNLLFLGRLVIEPKMAPSVRNLLRSQTESLFDKRCQIDWYSAEYLRGVK